MAIKAKLIIGRDKFSSLLAKRIADGKYLLAKDVPSERQSQDSYLRIYCEKLNATC